MSWSPDKILERLERLGLKGVKYLGEVEIGGRKYWKFEYNGKIYLAWVLKDQLGREHLFFWYEKDIKNGRLNLKPINK